MILLSLGLIMSLILIVLILKAPNIKNKLKNKEGFVRKPPEGAWPNGELLDKYEMKYVDDERGLIQQKQDPKALMMSMNEMNTYIKLPREGGYNYHDVKSVVPEADFKKAPNKKANTSKLTKDILSCKALTDCDQLTGMDCGYCVSSGKFSYGDDGGPKTDTCKKGEWAMTPAKCKEVKDRKICSDIASCPELAGIAAEKCGFCPTTGLIMAKKKSGDKYVPKYSSDTCNYDGGLVIGDQCAAFATQNPCITPYSNTGPHSEECLKTLWRNSGCTGEYPYNKTFTQLKKDLSSISVGEISQAFKKIVY